MKYRALVVAVACSSLLFGVARCVGDSPTSPGDGGPSDATSDAPPDGASSPDGGDSGDACTMTCSGKCADLQTDGLNCGTCGNACAQGLACVAGHCGGVVSVATSRDAACALRTDGSVWCWGSTADGETGVPPKVGADPSPTGVGPTTLTKAVELVGGDGFFCARQSDHSLWCWGQNYADQLGHVSSADPTCAGPQSTPCNATPQAVTLPSGVVPTGLAAGSANACFTAANSDGGAGSDLYCWGRGTYLFAGPDTPTPVRIAALDGQVSSVSVGWPACVVTPSSEALCWGDNSYNQLGHKAGTGGDQNPSFLSYYNPTPSPVLDGTQPLTGIATVKAGGSFVCARKTDDTVWCWGFGWVGQLGTGSGSVIFGGVLPAQVPSLAASALLGAGDSTMFVRGKSGNTQAWGDNSLGELGTSGLATGSTCAGTFQVPCAPSPIVSSSLLDDVTEVSMEVTTGLALLPDGRIAAWGSNASSVLGHAPGQQGDLVCVTPNGPDGGTPCSPTATPIPPLP